MSLSSHRTNTFQYNFAERVAMSTGAVPLIPLAPLYFSSQLVPIPNVPMLLHTFNNVLNHYASAIRHAAL